jgi:hypothetical protein
MPQWVSTIFLSMPAGMNESSPAHAATRNAAWTSFVKSVPPSGSSGEAGACAAGAAADALASGTAEPPSGARATVGADGIEEGFCALAPVDGSGG